MRTESSEASKKTSRDDSGVGTMTKTFKAKATKLGAIMREGKSIQDHPLASQNLAATIQILDDICLGYQLIKHVVWSTSYKP